MTAPASRYPLNLVTHISVRRPRPHTASIEPTAAEGGRYTPQTALLTPRIAQRRRGRSAKPASSTQTVSLRHATPLAAADGFVSGSASSPQTKTVSHRQLPPFADEGGRVSPQAAQAPPQTVSYRQPSTSFAADGLVRAANCPAKPKTGTFPQTRPQRPIPESVCRGERQLAKSTRRHAPTVVSRRQRQP